MYDFPGGKKRPNHLLGAVYTRRDLGICGAIAAHFRIFSNSAKHQNPPKNAKYRHFSGQKNMNQLEINRCLRLCRLEVEIPSLVGAEGKIMQIAAAPQMPKSRVKSRRVGSP